MPEPIELTRAERALTQYKRLKGCAELVLAVVLVILIATGELPVIAAKPSAWLPWHPTFPALARETMSVRHMILGAVALVGDGMLTLTEGWALSRGQRWGHWLVVAATGILLPFELAALFHHPTPLEAVGFAFNVVVVAYLARRAAIEA